MNSLTQDPVLRLAKSLAARLRGAETRVSRSRPLLHVELGLRSRVSKNVGLRWRPRDGHLLVPTVGQGNIGDQAMLEAFLEFTSGPVTVACESEDSHRIPESHASRVRTVVLPGAFSAPWWRARRSRRTLHGLLLSHQSVSIVGADIMDGGYDALESISRLALLARANMIGLDSRLLGFSWNGQAPDVVCKALRRTQPGTRLLVRDPVSAQRLRDSTGAEVVEAADMVFCLQQNHPYPPIDQWLTDLSVDVRVTVVNASGLVGRNPRLVAEYQELIEKLLSRGSAVVVLPHVLRIGDDDGSVCRQIAEPFISDRRLFLIEEQLSPSQIANVTARAASVITGRMHLGIIALTQGTPAAIVATQGKVEGMLGLFGLSHLALSVEPGFCERALQAIGLMEEDAVRAVVLERLQEVRRVAYRNFE